MFLCILYLWLGKVVAEYGIPILTAIQIFISRLEWNIEGAYY